MLDSQIEEIKNKLDIVEVIGGYIKLKKAGANYRGVCPFHSEKKPSFFVSPARQIWHCFGCGAGHSVFDFVMKIEGVEFGDALKILAQKAGVELKRQDPKLKTARQRLYEICELACRFFEKQLQESLAGKEIKNYLLKRGINEESIKKWRLGYAPDIWRSLTDFLVVKGYNREEVERAGLSIKSEKSQGYYDRFRARIIFPIFDLNSQVVGFGGRITEGESKPKTQGPEEQIAKYINTPQTLLYDKSRILYGLNNAKIAIRKEGKCILVEGYTDVIMSHQAGFENTVAVSGTALTPFHLNILKRYSENLVLAFDMDIAGDTATKRGIDLAQQNGFGIKITKLPEDSDPADIVSKDPKDWDKIVKESRSILDFYFDSAFSSFDKKTADGKKQIGKIILPVIKRIPNKIEQSHWVQELAKKLEAREEDVFEELKKTKTSTVSSPETSYETAEDARIGQDEFSRCEGRKQIIEEKIISLLIKEPDNLNLVNLEEFPFFSEKSKKLLEELKNQGEKEDLKTVFANLENTNDEKLKNFLSSLLLRAEVEYEEHPEEEIQLCLSELKNIEIKNKLKEVSGNLKRAEAENNQAKINSLMEEFDKLTKELK